MFESTVVILWESNVPEVFKYLEGWDIRIPWFGNFKNVKNSLWHSNNGPIIAMVSAIRKNIKTVFYIFSNNWLIIKFLVMCFYGYYENLFSFFRFFKYIFFSRHAAKWILDCPWMLFFNLLILLSHSFYSMFEWWPRVHNAVKRVPSSRPRPETSFKMVSLSTTPSW